MSMGSGKQMQNDLSTKHKSSIDRPLTASMAFPHGVSFLQRGEIPVVEMKSPLLFRNVSKFVAPILTHMGLEEFSQPFWLSRDRL